MKKIKASKNQDGRIEILFERQERLTITQLDAALVRIEWIISYDYPPPRSSTSGGSLYHQDSGTWNVEIYGDRFFNFIQGWLSLEQMASLDLVKYLTPHQIATLKTQK